MKEKFNLRKFFVDASETLWRLKLYAETEPLFVQHALKNKLKTTPAEREKASEMVGQFAAEIFDFFSDNLVQKLQPLSPSLAQINVFDFFLENFKAKKVQEFDVQLRSGLGDAPYVSKQFQALYQELSAAHIADISAVAITEYGVHPNFPHAMAVEGHHKLDKADRLDFITFPTRLESTAQAIEFLGVLNTKPQDQVKAQVYDQGKRLIIHRTEQTAQEEVVTTLQYFLIGAYEGLTTQRDYWVYGMNGSEHKKHVVRARDGVAVAVAQAA